MIVFKDLKRRKKIIYIFILIDLIYAIFVFKRIILSLTNQETTFVLNVHNLISIFICFYGFVLLFWGLKDVNIFMKHISASEIDNLITEVIEYRKDEYLFSKKIIFDYATLEFISYNDILCIYNKTKIEGHSPGTDIVKKIVVVTKKKKYIFRQSSMNDEMCDLKFKNLSEIIIEKNPNVLVGNTKENKKILEEKYRIKI